MSSEEIARYLAIMFSTPGHKYTTKQIHHAAKYTQINDRQHTDATGSGHSKLGGGQQVWYVTKCVIFTPSDSHSSPQSTDILVTSFPQESASDDSHYTVSGQQSRRECSRTTASSESKQVSHSGQTKRFKCPKCNTVFTSNYRLGSQ